MATCFELARDEQDPSVAHLRLSRPESLNTMIPEFWRELPEIVAGLDRAGDTRVLVISSTGRHFSAGMDLSVFTGGGSSLSGEAEVGRVRANLRLLVKRLQDSFSALERARFPVVAAIHGGCVGGAVDMVCACDLRYASRDAFFCVQETNIGMVADVGTLQRLPKLIPEAIAKQWAYTGERVAAQRAYEVGFLNGLFDDHESLIEGALEVARTIASKSPLVIWGVKDSIGYARDHSVEDSLDRIALWQTGMLQPADMIEALSARDQGRDPKYSNLLPIQDELD